MKNGEAPRGGMTLPESVMAALGLLDDLIAEADENGSVEADDCEALLSVLGTVPLAASLAAATIARSESETEGAVAGLTALLCEVATSSETQAVAHHLAACAWEREGHGLLVLQHLEASYAALPLPNVTEWLADVRSIQGVVPEALKLLEEAGIQGDDMSVQVLRKYLAPPVGAAGRNRPCECGSGKKSKLCHGKTAVHPLSARSLRIWLNLLTFVQRPAFRTEVLHWASLVSGEGADAAKTLGHALHNDLVHDLMLFDDELIHQFDLTYSVLMPPDEAELLQSWCDSERQFLEVTEILPMRCVVCRDLASRPTPRGTRWRMD